MSYKVGDTVLCKKNNIINTGIIQEIKYDYGQGYSDEYYLIKLLSGAIKDYEDNEIHYCDKQYFIDKLYLKMALIWSENSYAIRRKVGCLIVKNRMIISDGYNGTPIGFNNLCEYYINKDNEEVYTNNIEELINAKNNGCELITKPFVLHAEANAITKLAKSSNNSNGATLYVTDEPCIECSKLIIQSGIVRVVYINDYRKHEGIDLLTKYKIEVQKITISELEK